MNEPLRVYFVQDDVEKTLEEIYRNEQRPFKISLLINKGTCDPNSPILIEKDTMRFQEVIEDYDGKCITPEIVGFKLYRLI